LKSFPILSIVVFALSGCSPKEESTSPVERQPSPTPAGQKFTILSDASGADSLFLKSYLDKLNPRQGTYYLEWVGPEDDSGQWDFALLRPWNLDLVDRKAVDLKPMLERVYPRHTSDFFIPIEALESEEGLKSLPITIVPDFLFAMNRPQWNFQFDPAVFAEEVASGKKVGISAGPLVDFYRNQLGLQEDQVVEIDLRDPENPFLKGNLEFAIGPKGWLLEKQVPGLSVIGLAGLPGVEKVPHSGYQIALSADSAAPEIGEAFFANLVTEGQLSMVGVADSFPIRRSVYSAPRIQGPMTAFYKQAFDQTLANLDPVFPSP